MSVVSMSYLLETGVHFGHQTKRWNPKMKEYIFTSRGDIYIIDLEKSAKKIEEAYNAVKNITLNGGKVLFVGTRKQASEAIKAEAIRSESYYIAERWLGGTLTNFRTIRKRVRRLENIEKMEQDGTFEKLPKKEVIKIKKEYDKLNKILCGIRDMNRLPQALFVVDPSKEIIAIKEARILNIPIIGIVDTNCDPDMVDYVIPGNDDAIRAVKLITGVIANAVVEANGGTPINFIKETNGDENIMEKAVESVNRNNRRPSYNNNRRDFRPNYNRDNRGNNNNRSNYSRPNNAQGTNNFRPNNAQGTNNFRPNNNAQGTNNFRPNNTARPINPVVKKEVVKPVEVKKEIVKPVAVKKPIVKEVAKDLTKNTVVELRTMAKAKSVKGFSTMKKAELIKALN